MTCTSDSTAWRLLNASATVVYVDRHVCQDLQRWPAQTGHELQCFLLVAPSLSLSEQLKLCLVCLPGHLPNKLSRFVLERGSSYMPGGSSDRRWWQRLWWGDNVILGCRSIPQMCQLRPATTAADITRLQGCLWTALSCWLRTLRPAPCTQRLLLQGAPQSLHLLPHFLDLGLDDFSASLALLSHCYQFLLELFCQVLVQPLAVFQAIKFSSLFQSGSLPSGISLPLTSESATVHVYPATSLAKLYPKTPDTNCYDRRPTSRDRKAGSTLATCRVDTMWSCLEHTGDTMWRP
ncbi:hypothetical protein E2C01_006295 [Portunus trituberculatus]|uniref:Uncharacterized protein n=1 Tax=Portunus trituberculatus TaxID=210409 RepID=A0A5B7CUQ2_PORTR|nr:hypothetical protein [Portunus trituberculatus]